MVQVVRRPEVEETAPVRFALERWVGAVGAIIALLGVWLGVAPEDGTMSIFGRDLDVAGLSDAWYQLLVIGGLAVIGLGFALAGRKLRRRDGWWSSPVVWAFVMAVVSAGAAAAFAVAWLA